MLIGYEYGRRDREQGEELLVTLYWQALESVSKDYIAEVRLLDSDKKIWAADDRQPSTRPASTADWHQGLITIDTHRLVIDPTAPAGTYLVEVALLDTEADMRQNIIAPDGHWIDDHLLLAPIQIKP